MKKLIIPESELTNIIQKAVGKNLLNKILLLNPKLVKLQENPN